MLREKSSYPCLGMCMSPSWGRGSLRKGVQAAKRQHAEAAGAFRPQTVDCGGFSARWAPQLLGPKLA